jgi:hypothetical protein
LLTRQIEELPPNWAMAAVVIALQAMRGFALVVVVTLVAEVGDFRRFPDARRLMTYLRLAPSKHSSGASVRRGGITNVGNALARRVLTKKPGRDCQEFCAEVGHDRSKGAHPCVDAKRAEEPRHRRCADRRRRRPEGLP